MKSNDKLDNLIKQSFDNDKSYGVPELDDVWDKIQKHIDNKKKKNKMMKRLIGIVATLIIMSIGSIFILDNEGYASYMRTLKMFVGLEDKSSINIDNKAPDEMNVSIEEIVSIEKIEKLASFPVKQIEYIPRDYKYNKSHVSKLKSRIISVQSMYISSEEVLTFTQEPIDKIASESIKINPDIGEVYKKSINGYKYNIIDYNNGELEVIWDISEVKYILKGSLDKEEMMKIALSIK